MKKLYVVQKYVKARSVVEAMRLEKGIVPDDVYVDNEWRKGNPQFESRPIGFKGK